MENSKNLLPRDTRSMTADIVAAYVSHNKVSVEKLTEVIETVYRSLVIQLRHLSPMTFESKQ